ncbi:MAG: hypothetical protein ACXVWZ_08580 [Nocardioides sp.]
MKKPLAALVATTTVLVCGLGVSSATGAPSGPQKVYEPTGDTIVDVSGDKLHGFTIRRYDGSVLTPPEASEAHAACAAMDPGLERIRCRVQARVWYRDLTQMKKAINYAKYGS